MILLGQRVRDKTGPIFQNLNTEDKIELVSLELGVKIIDCHVEGFVHSFLKLWSFFRITHTGI